MPTYSSGRKRFRTLNMSVYVIMPLPFHCSTQSRARVKVKGRQAAEGERECQHFKSTSQVCNLVDDKQCIA